jgi:hypothetical protein
MRQARTAEPQPQLEAVLQCLFVVVVRHVLRDNGVVSFADFTSLLGLGLPLLWNLDFLRGRGRLRDKLLQVILQKPTR